MTNLLHATLSRSELQALFEVHPPRPLPPPISDDAWRRVRENPLSRPWREAIRSAALANAGKPMPELTGALYADFALTGQRLAFEDVYFQRRRRMARAMLASLLEPLGPDRAVLLASARATVQSIFDEPSWALPAHVNNSTGKDASQIDLFSAETADVFGTIVNLLGDELPADLRGAIDARLRRLTFEHCVAQEFWWTRAENNWNAVCH